MFLYWFISERPIFRVFTDWDSKSSSYGMTIFIFYGSVNGFAYGAFSEPPLWTYGVGKFGECFYESFDCAVKVDFDYSS